MKSTDLNWDGADDYDYHEIVRNTRIIVDYHGIMEMMIIRRRCSFETCWKNLGWEVHDWKLTRVGIDVDLQRQLLELQLDLVAQIMSFVDAQE